MVSMQDGGFAIRVRFLYVSAILLSSPFHYNPILSVFHISQVTDEVLYTGLIEMQELPELVE